jgi:hypothetical protein
MTLVTEHRTRGRGALIVLTAVAAPAALGFETLLRWLIFPDDFELVRELLRPTLTIVAWALCAVCAVAAVAGVTVQQRLASRAVAKLGPAADADRVARARLGGFLLAASIPQVPAVLATFAFMFGASIVPVLVAITIVTVAVVVQATRGSTNSPSLS